MFSKETDRKYKRRIIISFLWFTVFITAILLGYNYSVKNIGFQLQQPVKFNHKVHSGDYGMKCLYCHFTAETSQFSAIPTTWSCMVCHLALKNQTELMKLVNKSFDDTIPIIWNRVYVLPDFVHFNHSRHIRAMMDCSSCHGEVEKMDTVRQETALTMGWCLNCHRDPAQFVKQPRDITGIFTYGFSKSENKNIGYTDVILPSYGLFITRVTKPLLYNIPMPKQPGRGPETCSACHY